MAAAGGRAGAGGRTAGGGIAAAGGVRAGGGGATLGGMAAGAAGAGAGDVAPGWSMMRTARELSSACANAAVALPAHSMPIATLRRKAAMWDMVSPIPVQGAVNRPADPIRASAGAYC